MDALSSTADATAHGLFWREHTDKSDAGHEISSVQMIPGGVVIQCAACDFIVEVTMYGGKS